MTLVQDRENLGGQFCLGVVSPGCFPLRGRVQSNGSFQIDVAGDAPFRFNGTIGAIVCQDGSTGKTLAGTFHVRESSGTFSFNNCP